MTDQVNWLLTDWSPLSHNLHLLKLRNGKTGALSSHPQTRLLKLDNRCARYERAKGPKRYVTHTSAIISDSMSTDLAKISKKMCFLEDPSEFNFAMTYNSHFVPFSFSFLVLWSLDVFFGFSCLFIFQTSCHCVTQASPKLSTGLVLLRAGATGVHHCNSVFLKSYCSIDLFSLT